MIHTANNIEEIKYFFKEIEEDEIVRAFVKNITQKSKDLFSKVLLIQNDKEKFLIHFNNVAESFEKRQDLKAIFLMYYNSSTEYFDLKGFMNGNESIREVAEFLKEKSNKAFSDYVSCEIYSHLNALDESYKEKMLTLDPEELYSHLENNNVDIHYIRKLFNNDKKVNSSLLVNSILNDKNNIILNTNDENLYDENLKECLKIWEMESLNEIDLEHFAYRYLLAIKDSEIRFSNISKVIKLLTALDDSVLESVFQKIDDERTKKDYETVKRTTKSKWTNFDAFRIKIL